MWEPRARTSPLPLPHPSPLLPLHPSPCLPLHPTPHLPLHRPFSSLVWSQPVSRDLEVLISCSRNQGPPPPPELALSQPHPCSDSSGSSGWERRARGMIPSGRRPQEGGCCCHTRMSVLPPGINFLKHCPGRQNLSFVPNPTASSLLSALPLWPCYTEGEVTPFSPKEQFLGDLTYQRG